MIPIRSAASATKRANVSPGSRILASAIVPATSGCRCRLFSSSIRNPAPHPSSSCRSSTHISTPNSYRSSGTSSRPISTYLRDPPPLLALQSIRAVSGIDTHRQTQDRSLHSSATASKDKRWVNSTKDGKESEDAESAEEGSPEAEGESKEGEKVKEVRQEIGRDIEGEAGPSSSSSKSSSAAVKKDGTADSSIDPKSTESSTASTSSSSSSSSPSSSSSSSASSSSAPPSNGSSGSSSSSNSGSSSKEIAKPSIPENYPQVLALPITRRPLFPGFYKAVTITSPPVIRAIRELLAHGQPYIGAFLLKDSSSDSDVITSIDQVHPVGVFAQITSVFGSGEAGSKKADSGDKDKDGKDSSSSEKEKPETLTAVLYPHRRVRIDELITQAPPPRPAEIIESREQQIQDGRVPLSTLADEVKRHQAKDSAEGEEAEGDVASFERDVPSVESVREEVGTAPRERDEDVASEGEARSETKSQNTVVEGDAASSPEPIQSHIGFLHPLLPSVSLTNICNLGVQPYKKDSQMVRAIMGELVSVFKDIAQLQPIFREQITSFTMSNSTSNVFDEPDNLADFAAAVSTGDVDDLQAVLESLSVEDRLQKALLILKKELINAQLQNKISRDVESKIQKRQREYYLMEQLKGIKKELGMESDGKDKLVERFKEKASKLAMPEGVRKVFDDEINKLMHLEPAASEFNVTRNYLDWLTQVPWGVHSPESYNISHARTVLDEDHYGLKDVKDRILEVLAIGKLRGTVEGKIICLAGPPGVGKTSIGKSIARALGRQFYRFSVGGLTDVAEIKGHRRTYVGAMPGKPIQALKKVATENPLILIDEVDKIGRGHNGDPSSALLEMLDPEQNNSFLDHYMDVPVDLSRVLFVCTANVLDTIPAPLLDRMEVLEVSGYVSAEKMNIASKYLSPQAKEASGLKDVDIVLEPEAIESLIRYYCRESGVRNLKKHIDKIYRKAAFKIVSDLGESALPEPPTPTPTASPDTSDSANITSTVETQMPDTKPASEALPSDSPDSIESSRTTVTAKPREPLKLPSSISVRVTHDNLKEYVGPSVYHKDRLYTSAPPAGVSTGLGYLGNGSGAVMPIEVSSMPGKGNLQLTGKLGEVIRESAQIALTWVKSNAWNLGVTKSEAEMIMNDRDLHLHMPEGAIGKEGPSAGTAILTALVSLFTKTKVDPDIAMTGEISLLGQVLPVGGLKEKILAAHRAGIKKLIVPAATKSDIDENVPDSVKSGIEFVFVEDVRQVLHEVFKGTEAGERWKETLPSDKAPERVSVA